MGAPSHTHAACSEAPAVLFAQWSARDAILKSQRRHTRLECVCVCVDQVPITKDITKSITSAPPPPLDVPQTSPLCAHPPPEPKDPPMADRSQPQSVRQCCFTVPSTSPLSLSLSRERPHWPPFPPPQTSPARLSSFGPCTISMSARNTTLPP